MFDNENKATRGSIIQIILTALSSGSKYGYEICKEIERLSSGVLLLKQPSLYSSLRRMEEQGLISSYWTDSELGGKRHYYTLTDEGREYYKENCENVKMEDLIKNLPLNEFSNDMLDNKNNEESSSSSQTTYVLNQENLFNLARRKENVKLINENENQEEKNKSFFQFDLFNENVKFIKEDSKHSEKIQAYTNKYAGLNNKDMYIEPIKREDVFKDTKKTHKSIDEVFYNEKLEIPQTQTNEIIKDFPNSFLSTSMLNSSLTHEIKEDKENKQNNNLNETTYFNFTQIKQTPTSFTFSTLNNDSQSNETNLLNEIDDMTNHKDKETIDDSTNLNVINTSNYLNNQLNKLNDFGSENTKTTPKTTDYPEHFNSIDYKNVISKLYNDSKLQDPYEKNKYKTFKELFPSSTVINKKNNIKKESEINNYVSENLKENKNNDLEILNNYYKEHGFFIKCHNKDNMSKTTKQYTDVNKLNMVTSWIVCLIMICEITSLFFIVKKYNGIEFGKIMYFIAGIIILSLFSISTLENIFDRFKLLILKKNYKNTIIKEILFFIFFSILIFAICLMFGMQSLLQIEFINYWAIPLLVCSNIIVYSIIYFALLKSKKFNR